MKAKINLTSTLLAAGLLGMSLSAYAAPDWSKVAKRTIQVFHPGVTPIEWIVTKGSGHGGANGFRNKGESCIGCHEDAGELNFDTEKLSTKPLEPVGAPATKIFPVAVQAAYDAENIYFRLSFKAPGAGAADAPREAKDPKHTMKVAVMLAGEKVPQATQAGCWATCHTDVRSMPGADMAKKKYVTGGDLDSGAYTDYFQWKSGVGGVGAVSLDGHVATERVNKDGKALVKAEGEEKNGEYVVTFTRKLTGGAGDLSLAEGKSVPFGIAIHADQVLYRFHHVSLGYMLGIGAEGDVKAMKF